MRVAAAVAAVALLVAGAAFAQEKEKPMTAALIAVGTEAPDFRLNDHNGNGVRLSSFRGKKWVVLAFYPKAMTPGCTREVCSLRDAAKEFEGAGIQVFGMSLDDVVSQAKFVKEQELNFPLLSDPDGSAAGRLGVLMADKPYTNRITVVVDDKGVVRMVDTGVKVDSHGKDLVAAILKMK